MVSLYIFFKIYTNYINFNFFGILNDSKLFSISKNRIGKEILMLMDFICSFVTRIDQFDKISRKILVAVDLTDIRKIVVRLSTRSQRDVSRDNGWRILKRHVTDKRQKMYSTCTQRARVERGRWKRPISLNGLVATSLLVFPRIFNNNVKYISLNVSYRSCESNLNIEFSLMIIDFKIGFRFELFEL